LFRSASEIAKQCERLLSSGVSWHTSTRSALDSGMVSLKTFVHCEELKTYETCQAASTTEARAMIESLKSVLAA
jgi:hypothetical protein